MIRYASGDVVREGDRVTKCGHDAEVTLIDPVGTFAPELGPGFMIRETTGIEIFITKADATLTLLSRRDG